MFKTKFVISTAIFITFLIITSVIKNKTRILEKQMSNLHKLILIKEKNINLPFYWVKNDNNYLINDSGKLRQIINNYPACHISWYEAEAICKWFGGRLPTESEWEYLATNGGKSKYPWTNYNKIDDSMSNNMSDQITNNMIKDLNLNFSKSFFNDISNYYVQHLASKHKLSRSYEDLENFFLSQENIN